jgi:hypothetical protein
MDGCCGPFVADRVRRLGPWAVVGAGVATLAAVALSVGRSAADGCAAAIPARTDRARSGGSQRTASRLLLGAGAVAIAGGLTWRFAF